MLKKTLESPLDCKEIQPVHPKENRSWIFIGRTDAEAEAPVVWPPDGKNWLIGKDSDAGNDWRQEEKGTTEDKKVGCHHRLNGQKFEQTLGDCEGQGRLLCCSPWGRKESDTTEQENGCGERTAVDPEDTRKRTGVWGPEWNVPKGSMVCLGNEAPLLTGMWSGGVGGITVPTCQPLPPQIPGGTPTRVSMPHSVTQLPANLHHHRQFTHTPVWLHSPVGLTKSASVSHCFRSLLHGCRTDARRGFTCRAGANTKSEPQGLCN